MQGYYHSDCNVTGSVTIDSIKKIVDDNNVYMHAFIDESGFDERLVTVSTNGTQFKATCQEYDDYEMFFSVVGDWEKVSKSLATYI